MNKFELNIKPFGKEAILIEWPNRIDEKILDDIICFTKSILIIEKSKLNNYTPGYNSLLLHYVSLIDFGEKKHFLMDLYNSQKQVTKYNPNTWHIPVCYDEEFGVDLPLFSNQGLTKKEVIHLHTSNCYRVFMIGFLPGFLYLGGLDPKLHMDRKAKPRLSIPKGSVAIGGEQTGIYPMASPGGWQIIGRTPLSLFDLNAEETTPIRQGDKIQFYAVDHDTYLNLVSD